MMMDVSSERSRASRQNTRHRVRHFLADFARLDEEFPESYPKMIVRGEGAYLIDNEGNRILDAGSHLGACQIGHARKEVAQRIARQVEELEFVALDGGVSHIYAGELAERLSEIAMCDDPIFSFTNSGSEANELAIKIARQYHARRGQPDRVKIVSRNGSYHGSTLATSAATGVQSFKTGIGPLPEGFIQSAQPSPGRCGHCGTGNSCSLACLDEFTRFVKQEGPETVAAIIAEPVAIPQAVKVPHTDYFSKLRSFCDEHGILLIIDEVVCGFGRTGRMFGAEHFGVKGDIVSYAKGLTSGYVPMGAVAVSRRIEAEFEQVPLLHLNTYAAHPVACAAALAALDVLESEQLVENARNLEVVLKRELERLRQADPRVREINVIGLLSSIAIDLDKADDLDRSMRRLRKLCYDHGLLARISRDGALLGVHFYPPLNVNEEDIVSGVQALQRALRDV
ncbi:aspartate aminotransferase family protein [Roseovarius sp.]|uniref:aminotransferase family protein n=1 Tax=Roseovarius sp. TaxID=1486281 RepID=UPI003D096EF8